MWPAALLLAVALTSAAPTQPSCPPLPDACSCDTDIRSGGLIVDCDAPILSDLFKGLGALPIERLRVTGCSQPTLNIMPKGLVRSISISNCRIKNIDPKVLAQSASSLVELSLTGNELTTLPKFPSMSKLESIDLAGNQLTDIQEDSLKDLSSLRFLRLKENKICNLSSNSLAEVKLRLEFLDLSSNCFKTVPAQNIRNCPRLQYLDLSGNEITELNNYDIMNLPELRELRLANNRLRSFHPVRVRNVPRLKMLYLQDNLLSSVDGTQLQAFSQLEVLHMANNLLQTVPSLKELAHLQQVRLEGNLIDKLDTLTFSNNPRLRLITLQDNNIAQIARNSFDGLDAMTHLILANNSIDKIDRGMIDGMRHLQQLNLRNNSITKIDANTFTSVPELTSLDLGFNEMQKIPKSTFDKLEKLSWLDLSHNQLQGFEPNTFGTKIGNLLLHGNQFVCDEKFDWFVQYLVVHQVRTFLPQQQEITCAGPAQYAGTKLKDLMLKKTNDALNEGMKVFGVIDNAGGQRSLLSSFIPGLTGGLESGSNALGSLIGGIPILESVTKAIPAIQNFTSMIPAANGGAQPVPSNRGLNGAIDQFAAPLLRYANGGQPVASDVHSLIQSIPNLVVNVPGFGDIDLAKLDPALLDLVIKTGQIPGLSRENSDMIIKQIMMKMHDAAAAATSGAKLSPDQAKYLPPVDRLPQSMVTEAIKTGELPGLNREQTKTITDYYTMAIATQHASPNSTGAGFSKDVLELKNLLPENYNISKIPTEIITAIMKGEIPDLKKLPADLMEHFKANADKFAVMFTKAKSGNTSLEELMKKLPKFEKPVLPTFSPYDINKLSSEMIHDEEVAQKAARVRLYTAIALGLVGAATVVVLAIFVFYIKKQRQKKSNQEALGTSSTMSPPSIPIPVAHSTMRDTNSPSTTHLRQD